MVAGRVNGGIACRGANAGSLHFFIAQVLACGNEVPRAAWPCEQLSRLTARAVRKTAIIQTGSDQSPSFGGDTAIHVACRPPVQANPRLP